MDIIKLACPSCGAPVEIEPEDETFACAHCGTSLAVKRSGGKVALHTLTAKVEEVRAAVEKTGERTAAAADRTTAALILPDAKKKLKYRIDEADMSDLWMVLFCFLALIGLVVAIRGSVGTGIWLMVIFGGLATVVGLLSKGQNKAIAAARAEIKRLEDMIAGLGE